MKPIYEPKGKAKEYGDYALNIYTGCPHRCYYCFAPNVLRRDREKFHSDVRPRENIVEETIKQLEWEHITGKLIHLCFTCDPYPTGYDTSTTREIIKVLKAAGNRVQILTKGDGRRDFDLLDAGDWYGITVDGLNMSASRTDALCSAYEKGIKTWISFEPVVDADKFFTYLRWLAPYTDRVKIGKLNYHPSNIDWAKFGADAEALCKKLGIDYYIKDSLRREMDVAKGVEGNG